MAEGGRTGRDVHTCVPYLLVPHALEGASVRPEELVLLRRDVLVEEPEVFLEKPHAAHLQTLEYADWALFSLLK